MAVLHPVLPPRILLVDDDLRLRDLLVSFLGNHDMHVTGVGDGTEMMHTLTQQTFDLYILDINLPGMSGWDICKQLRGHGDNTPIVMLTARSEDHDRIHPTFWREFAPCSAGSPISPPRLPQAMMKLLNSTISSWILHATS